MADRATSDGGAIGRIHPPAGEDVDVRRERHRRGSVRQERLQPGPTFTKQDDGRGRPGLDRAVRHAGLSHRPIADDELGSERGGIGHRQPAREAATDVGARPAVDRRSVVEQRHRARRHRPPRAPRPGSAGIRDRASASSAAVAGSSGLAHDRDLDGGRQREVHRAEPLGEPGRVPRRRTGRPCAWPARRRPGTVPSPVHAASRSRTRVAIALPDGTALSWTSLGRVTSRSWSSAVSKKPPAGSAKRARTRSIRARAVLNQRSSKVASYSASRPSARSA